MTSSELTERDWKTIIRNIREEKCTPLIGNQLVLDTLFGTDDVIKAWAAFIDCPTQEVSNLTRVAQFLSVEDKDPQAAKAEFLEFLKLHLVQRARKSATSEQADFLQGLADQAERGEVTLSEVAEGLGLFTLGRDSEHPLHIIADLPISIYLTTSYHDFLEKAVKAAGKEPESDIAYWQLGLEDEHPSVFNREADYLPSTRRPLIYHLYGREEHTLSLVLTEDDHFDFLMRVSGDEGVIAPIVNQALAQKSILLLGYSLHGWDFRMILQALLRKEAPLRPKSVFIQLPRKGDGNVEDMRYLKYLHKYFNLVGKSFTVYWGSAGGFMRELKARW